MTRIFMLTTHPVAPPWDSADKQLARSIARSLPDYRFLLFGRVGVPQPAQNSTYIPIFSRKGKPGLAETLQVAAFSGILERQADLVHAIVTVGPMFRTFGKLRARVPRRLRRPMVLTVPGIRHARHVPTELAAEIVVALSDATADALREAGVDRIRVIPPGIPLEAWPVRPPAVNGRPSALFAGHYDPGGGAEDAILAIARIADPESRPRLVLAMRSRERSADRAEAKLRSLASAAGVDVQIHNEVRDMPALIAAATVVIFPARQLQGKADIPLTVLEALATGRPVIVAETPSLAALREAVSLVQPGDAEALAAELTSLLRDRRSCEERGAAGRRLVEQRFSEEAMAREYAALYEELLR